MKNSSSNKDGEMKEQETGHFFKQLPKEMQQNVFFQVFSKNFANISTVKQVSKHWKELGEATWRCEIGEIQKAINDVQKNTQITNLVADLVAKLGGQIMEGINLIDKRIYPECFSSIHNVFVNLASEENKLRCLVVNRLRDSEFEDKAIKQCQLFCFIKLMADYYIRNVKKDTLAEFVVRQIVAYLCHRDDTISLKLLLDSNMVCIDNSLCREAFISHHPIVVKLFLDNTNDFSKDFIIGIFADVIEKDRETEEWAKQETQDFAACLKHLADYYPKIVSTTDFLSDVKKKINCGPEEILSNCIILYGWLAEKYQKTCAENQEMQKQLAELKSKKRECPPADSGDEHYPPDEKKQKMDESTEQKSMMTQSSLQS